MPLETIDENIWMIDGPEVSFFGIPYPTRMVVVRLPDGLWIWSPVALTDEVRAAVTALGKVCWLVTPNKIHHLFLTEWMDAFPHAHAYAPPGLADKRTDLTFTGTLRDGEAHPWEPTIEQVTFAGSAVMDEVMFFHHPSSTCIVGDLIQRHDEHHFEGWKRAAMKIDDLTGEEGSTPREWRATFLNRDAIRDAFETALSWKPRHLIIAHGECAMENGAQVLRENLDWITKSWPA